MQRANVTNENPSGKLPSAPQSDARGTAAEGMGIVSLRVALARLRQEGRTVELVAGDDGSLIVKLPEMECARIDGKTRITYRRTEARNGD